MRPVLFIFCLLIGATALAAHQGVKNPHVLKRMEAMKQSKQAFNQLGDMAKGTLAYDRALAAKARVALIRKSTEYIELFEAKERDPKSEALDLIWERYPDFSAKARDMEAAFRILDVSSREALQAGLAQAGATCLSCHQAYRKKKE